MLCGSEADDEESFRHSQSLREEGAAKERAAVVAWFAAHAKRCAKAAEVCVDGSQAQQQWRSMRDDAVANARCIERGDHVTSPRTETKP